MAEAKIGGGFMNVATAGFWAESADGSNCGVDVQAFAGGECTITSVVDPTCDTACGEAEVCAWASDCAGGECVDPSALPEPLHAGGITIEGGSQHPSVTGAWSDDLQTYEFDVPSGEWWDDGDTLTVSAPGGAFPGFSVEVTAPVAPTVITDTSAWTPDTFGGTSDVPVEWVAGDGSFATTIVVITDQSMLLCVTGDDGVFDIPADGIAALGSAPPVWIVSIDYTDVAVVNEGADGETLVSAGTSGGSAFILNQ
jgi:hypothetical protein